MVELLGTSSQFRRSTLATSGEQHVQYRCGHDEGQWRAKSSANEMRRKTREAETRYPGYRESCLREEDIGIGLSGSMPVAVWGVKEAKGKKSTDGMFFL